MAVASNALAAYVRTVGLQFLGSASPSRICFVACQASSNITVILGGGIGGSTCGRPPVDFVGKSAIEFTLSGEQVEIEAWVQGQ